MIWCEVSHKNSDAVTDLLRSAKYELYGAELQPRQRSNELGFRLWLSRYPFAIVSALIFPARLCRKFERVFKIETPAGLAFARRSTPPRASDSKHERSPRT